MNYQQSLEFLYRRGNEVQGIHLGLHRIQAVLDSLGSPHLKFPALHIAGTNGKGSVAAMSESILRHSGWKTGLFTSPHLERIEERIRVGGRKIAPQQLAALVSGIRRKESVLYRSGTLDIRLTFFEFVTACAFLYFAKRSVDVAVVEVGLGGRLDATNLVRPCACVITGIAYDHTNLLGSTLAEIAREKAGIIKPSVPVVSGCRTPEARRVILERARRLQAPLLEIDRDCSLRVTKERRGRAEFDLQTPQQEYGRLRLSLPGRHQARNAAMAVTAIEASGFGPLKTGEVRKALASTHWPGRLDEYRALRRTLLDGAHNPEAARLLLAHLRRLSFPEVHLVFGAMQDKDFAEMGRILFPLARSIHLTAVPNPRSAQPEILAASHKRFRRRIRLHADPKAALRAAWGECSRNGVVVVTGSLYLVGELLPFVRRSAHSIPG